MYGPAARHAQVNDGFMSGRAPDHAATLLGVIGSMAWFGVADTLNCRDSSAP